MRIQRSPQGEGLRVTFIARQGASGAQLPGGQRKGPPRQVLLGPLHGIAVLQGGLLGRRAGGATTQDVRSAVFPGALNRPQLEGLVSAPGEGEAAVAAEANRIDP